MFWIIGKKNQEQGLGQTGHKVFRQRLVKKAPSMVKLTNSVFLPFS
jgi:hypothetical protein